jgi:hypothetical protein
MSRMTIVLSAATFLCTSQITIADESARSLEGSGELLRGRLLAVRLVRSWVGLVVRQSEIP